MITSDGYAIEFYRQSNQVVITMPQTLKTLTSTAAMVCNRKNLDSGDLKAILAVVKALCERKESCIQEQ